MVTLILLCWTPILIASEKDDTIDFITNSNRFYYKEEKYKKAKSLMERIFANNPVLTTFFSYHEDSDSIRLLEYQEIFDFTLNDKESILQFALGRGNFKEPGVSTVYEKTYSIGGIFCENQKKYRISYIYRDFGDAKDNHNYLLEYNGPIFFIDYVQLKHGYETVMTAKAVRANVKYYLNSFTLDEALPMNFSLTALYQFNKYNDENECNSEMIGLFYTLFKKPNFKIGYESHYGDARFSSPDYSTPNSLRINQVKVRLYDNIWNSKLYYDISYGFGFASEEGVEDKKINSAGVYIEYIVNDSLDFYIYYDLFKDTSFNGKTIQVAIKFRF